MICGFLGKSEVALLQKACNIIHISYLGFFHNFLYVVYILIKKETFKSMLI